MSGDEIYYYEPTTGLQFLIPVPINQVPPPRPPPSSLAALRTPEPAPLGSFQNPYPANSVVPLTIPPSTSTISTQYAPATAPSYDPTHQTQTTEIPVQYFQFIPLLCRYDDISGEQQGDTGPTQDNNHVSSSWWSAPPIPSPSETQQQQQTMMACTHCGHASNLHPAHAHPVPATTINPTLSPPTPYSQPQPQPHPPPSTNPNPTDNSTTPTAPSDPTRPAATPFLSRQDRNLDYEHEYEARKWADCYVCNDKPALREKEGVLFCLGCWAEAERAEVEMEMERGR